MIFYDIPSELGIPYFKTKPQLMLRGGKAGVECLELPLPLAFPGS